MKMMKNAIFIICFFSCSYVALAATILGSKFKIEDYGAENIYEVKKNPSKKIKTKSEELLSQCCFIIKGDRVPKPFRQLEISFTPRSKIIYSISGIFTKPKGVYLNNFKFKKIWNQCGHMINAETGIKPNDKSIDDITAVCHWNTGNEITASMLTSKDGDRIQMFILSKRLLEVAYGECPTGNEDKKTIEENFALETKKIEERKRQLSEKIESQRKWYNQQLRGNNLVEHSFEHRSNIDGKGETFQLALIKNLKSGGSIIAITEAGGYIICDGINVQYAKLLLEARKNIFYVDGK
jgi:hypothetical protein